jgi:hypothetical protein
MPEPRRTLLDIALDEGSVIGGILTDVRKAARNRVVNEVVGGVVQPRVDAVLARLRQRR